jgi:transposase
MIRQRGSAIMATVKPHLSIRDLEARYEAAADPIAKSHFHAVWLVASGYAVSEVAKLLSFSTRWVNILVKRYNEGGPERLGDQRVNNGTEPTILTPAALAALKERIRAAPDDGGLWTGPKIARWLARFHDVKSVHDQRGWDALVAIGYSIQQPRPRHPGAATDEERAAFKKNSRKPLPRSVGNIRGRKSRSGRRTSTASA